MTYRDEMETLGKQLLRKVYELSGGNWNEDFSFNKIGEDLGWRSGSKASEVATYLVEKSLVEWHGMGQIRLTQRAVEEIEKGGTIETGLGPWGPIQSVLFEFDSDTVKDIVEAAGLNPDWSLTEKEAGTHTTRKRAYRPRIQQEYNMLPPKDKKLFRLNVSREISRRGPDHRERINELLNRVGWALIGEELVTLQLFDPADLSNLPPVAHDDLVKAADRVWSDPTGAISAACGAVDSVTAEIYEDHALGDVRNVSFQKRVGTSLRETGSLDRLKEDLMSMGWATKKAERLCQNLKKVINQAAYVMQALRTEMGDVHGSKPTLGILVFDSVRWAMSICSLLQEFQGPVPGKGGETKNED